MSDMHDKMRSDWNKRARINARKYVALGDWKTEKDFYESGKIDAQKIIRDVTIDNTWVVLDFGVGVGRILRHLCGYFKEIYGVDVSDEMVKISKFQLKEFENVKIFQNQEDLSFFSCNKFDLVYSCYVFQHIPKKVFTRYLTEIHRVLKHDGLLKFQIFEKQKILNAIPWFWLRNLRRGHSKFWQTPPDSDSWVARSYSRDELFLILRKEFDVIKMENPSKREGDLWVTAKVKK